MKKALKSLAAGLALALTLGIFGLSTTTASAVSYIPMQIKSPASGATVYLTNGAFRVVMSSPVATNVVWDIVGVPTGDSDGMVTGRILGWSHIVRGWSNVINIPVPPDFSGGWTFKLVGSVFDPESCNILPIVVSSNLSFPDIPTVRLQCGDVELTAGTKTLFAIETRNCPADRRTTIWGFNVSMLGEEIPPGMITDFVFYDEATAGGTGTTYVDSYVLPTNLCDGWYRIGVWFGDGADQSIDCMSLIQVVGGVPLLP